MTETLRLIFPTQSIGLRVFWRLYRALTHNGGVGPCGFFVTNRPEYAEFLERTPEFSDAAIDCLKEWEILAVAHALEEPDLATIEEWERRIGDPTLWNALIIDRRFDYPLSAQFRQDYRPSYCHESLLKILQTALHAISAQFDRVRPHAVIGLNAVTLYDYLYYLMARQRGIPYFQLKLTRVRNYVSLYTEPFSLSSHITETFARIRANDALSDADQKALEEARALLDEVSQRSLTYEGAYRKQTHKGGAPKPPKAGLPQRLARALRAWQLRDPHYPTPWMSVLQLRFLRPLRRRLLSGVFQLKNVETFVSRHQGRYAVYPLNTEPEVALLAYGRPYRNQIETVRNLAAALPVGWKLVVKEHPNAYGYRTRGYYRKLLQIPNVVLAGPGTDTNRLVDGCGLVAMVFGTIGLEAIIKKKPLIALCSTPYGVFPGHMVRYVGELWSLADEIRDLLNTYRFDRHEVEAYLAAHAATGIRLNLFTELLGKGGRETMAMNADIDQQYASLAAYTRQRVAEESARLARNEHSGEPCAK